MSNMIEIVHADSLAWIVGRDPRAWSVLFIDPPYGIAYKVGSVPRARFHAPIRNDTDTSVRDAILAWYGDGAAAVFGTWKVPHWGRPRVRLVWDKKDMGGMGDLSFPWGCTDEEIAIYGRGWTGHRGGSVLRYPQPTLDKSHPHEKPVALLQSIIEKAPPGPVLDLTAGSGSTAVACSSLGRPCTVVEIDEQWIPVIERRVATEGAQRALFDRADCDAHQLDLISDEDDR